MENYKHVLISNEVWEQLKEYCERTGRSQKGFVEFLIKEYLNDE
jgi:predicted DNA-binding protein